MSAYLLGIETYLKIHNGLELYDNEYYSALKTEVNGLLSIRGFVLRMIRANQESVNTRYRENKSCDKLELQFINATYEFTPGIITGECPSIVGLIKLLDCWDYQSCEVDDWETNPLAIDVKRIQLSLYQKVVEVEYNQAPWGH